MKYFKVRKNKNGSIFIVDTSNNTGSSFSKGGGYSVSFDLTDAQTRRYLGGSGGTDIKHGGGKHIIEVVFLPKAVGDARTKASVINGILFGDK